MEKRKRGQRGPDRGPRKGYKKRDGRAVVCLEDNLLFYNAEDCAKYYGVTPDYVRKVCRGDRFPNSRCKHFEYYDNYREQQEIEKVERVNWDEWFKEYTKLSKEPGFKAWCRLQFLEAVKRAKGE